MNSKEGEFLMKTYGWVLAILFTLPLTGRAAESCRPKDDRAIVIGHTYKLDWFTTFRMKNSARLMGYKIKFQDLRSFASPEEGLRSVDALLVPGGADIDPNYYTKASLPAELLATIEKFKSYYRASDEGKERDPFEYSVYQTYYQSPEFTQLPALAICRGMQMMAVAKGVPLVLDIKAEMGIANRHYKFDRFHVTDASGIMGELFPEGSNIGFKLHHQNPRIDYMTSHPDRFPEIKISATSWDGRILEAIELQDRTAIGVQFHPEKSFPKVKHRFFRWLLKNACEYTHQGDK
ncbi:MAG: gamma-glutamyl-gamma-aminobutyrate hydrolase family protein [Bacteriovoracaceae bacterium]|nr:gamma-glutamyl-gamma-aminobutyrate hydrolase family protein [Bacteriovoracaceae bacterium]